MSKNVILKNRKGEQVFPATTLEQVHYEGNMNLKQAIHNMTAHAFTANSADEMTDKTKIYVYTGTGSTYRHGYWYYWSGNFWQPGGEYGALLEVDDIKIGYDGTVYDTPGDAVRTQVAEIRNDMVTADGIGESAITALKIKDKAIDYNHLSEGLANVEWEREYGLSRLIPVGINNGHMAGNTNRIKEGYTYAIRIRVIFFNPSAGADGMLVEDGTKITVTITSSGEAKDEYRNDYELTTKGGDTNYVYVKIPKKCSELKIEGTISGAERKTGTASIEYVEFREVAQKLNFPLLEVEKKHLSQEVIDLIDSKAANIEFATEEEAREGINDHTVMSPLRVAQAIDEMGGGGGGGIVTIPTMTSSFTGGSFSVNEEIEIRYRWGSPNSGNGTLHVLIDSIEFTTSEVTQGMNRYTLTGLSKGSHSIQMYVVDRGGQYTDTLKFTIKVGTLDITSSFDDSVDFAVTQIIKIPITIDTISLEPIYITRTIDNESVRLLAENGYNVFQLPTLTAGAHKVSFKAESSVYISNILTFDIVIEDSDTLTLISDFDKTTVTYRELVEIPYRVSLKGAAAFQAAYYVDGELNREAAIPAGSNIWSTRDLSVGAHTLKVVVTTLDGAKSAELTWKLQVNSSSYTPLNPVVDASLLCWLDASDKTNQDTDRETWADKSGNETPVALYNLNYGSNGWIDGALKLNGGAYAEIDLQALKDNAPYGVTVDVKYRTRDVGNQEACVLDMRGSGSNNKGFAVDTMQMYLNSGTSKIKSDIAEEELSRATFVVDRDNRLAKIYNNGVLTEAFIMGASEDFYNTSKIYLNATLGNVDGVWQPVTFGSCEIYSIRVYARALESEEVVQNLVADIPDLDEQEEKYNINYKNNMPTMYFYGDTSAMTKDFKVPLRIKYISPDSTKYGESFDLTDCPVSWQGTSSLQYAVKNYKIRLRNQGGAKYKYSPFGGILEDTFCLKADYMESSHANNTGMAKFIHHELYNEQTPAGKLDERCRTTIDGFPIQLYIAKDSVSTPVYMGVFNFNLDKSCNATYGMDNSITGFENCCKFEVSSNSDTSAGAFRDDSDLSIREDFEIAYPDEDDLTADQLTEKYNTLKRMVSWVKNSDETTFKAELEQYFNREYLMKYFLQAHLFGMVDNLGKNMMLCTWDGLVWYPTFYDMDTQLGLDNTGYLEFYSDCDVVEGVYNTSNSKLFVMLQTCFAEELAEMYRSMRMSGKYSVNTVLKYWYDQQVAVIGESQYNKDMEAKYIQFKNDYLFMLHGRRYEHMKKWITERMLYLDTIYGYEADTSTSITIRANKAATVSLDILTYSPQYLKVKWRNGVEQRLKIGRDANGRMKAVKFSGTLTTATDQEIIIYNAKQIKQIEGLANLNPSVLNLVEASRLTKVECGNSPLLADVRLSGANTFLSRIDFNRCTALTGSLDLSALDNLEYVNVRETKLTNVIFPEGGCNLKEINIAIPTLKSLDIRNMPLLTKLEICYPAGGENVLTGTFSAFKVIDCPDAVIEPAKALEGYFTNIIAEDIKIEGSPKLLDNGSMCGINMNATAKLTKCDIKGMKGIQTLKIKCCELADSAPTLTGFSIDCEIENLQIFGLGFVEMQEKPDINFAKIKRLLVKKFTNIKTLPLTSNLKGIYIAQKNNVFACGGWVKFKNSTSTNQEKFENSASIEKVTMDGVEVIDTLDFSKHPPMDLLSFGEDVLPEGINTIKLDCDFTNAYDVPDYLNSQYAFQLPVKMNVKGSLKTGGGANKWCTATASSYPPMETLDELKWDFSITTNFSEMFNNWRNLKHLPAGLYERMHSAKNLSGAFSNLTALEEMEAFNGKDLNLSEVENITSLFAGTGAEFSIGNLTAPKLTGDRVYNFSNGSGLTEIGNIVLDSATYVGKFLQESPKIKRIGEILAPAATNIQSTFGGSSRLERIEKLKLSDTASFKETFQGCRSLTHCIFASALNTSFKDAGISSCPLDAESVASMIACLDTLSQAATLSLHPTAFANLTEEQITQAAAKNWTLASA